MIPRSPLDDPHKAAHAWARYRQLMRLMLAITLVVIVIAVAALYMSNGMVSMHLYVATILGIGFTMLLTSALMGLIFLSNGTGHDEAITNLLEDDKDWHQDE